ncbi:hypothetical protein BDN71DRAFT_1480302 [Pleurotus eryngii]|uniref:Uncharacterized protein n=1 Tax=Pleurotus eryngii TaxID=5323 RepID=A0A9P6DJX1_PLEER|nr:hypothetical protein BDN71DRAFT_1480302 [Pleurotus eryngii]
MRSTFSAGPLRQLVSRPFTRSRAANVHGARFSSSNAGADAAQKKAQDALSSAQKNAEKLWESTKTFLEPVTAKAGQMLGSYKQPLVYNFSVARELVKQVYHAEGLRPPTSTSTLKSAYSTLWSRASSPAYWRTIASNGEIARVGIYAVEAYTIFKVGEIIGRRSLVGYNLD